MPVGSLMSLTSSLLINVGKTKEPILKQAGPFPPLTLCEQTVEVVDCFEYFGRLIECRLSFVDNVDAICKKASQRLFLMRKLKGFRVSQHILVKVFVSLKESILRFHISVWFGRLTLTNKKQIGQDC